MTIRKWTVTILSSLIIIALTVFLGIWWWRSLGFVSTDDARIKADIVSISAEIGGRIKVLTKDEGDSVAPGEVMARLDNMAVLIQILGRRLSHGRDRPHEVYRGGDPFGN